VLVAPDSTRRILDEDEFAANASRYNYPAAVRDSVPRALAELIGRIERRDYPFDWNA
jgi:protein associated with RNAse G/E